MAGSGEPGSEYLVVRRGIAVVLVAVVVVIVLADSLGLGRPVEPVILGALLLTAAGMVAVDLPALRR